MFPRNRSNSAQNNYLCPPLPNPAIWRTVEYKLNGKPMSAKKRILFIANEMSPYLELTDFSEIANKLAIKANDNNFEVRCIMPRFGIINERRHRLHEVVRLSGINVSVDNEDMPLQIKVASVVRAGLLHRVRCEDDAGRAGGDRAEAVEAGRDGDAADRRGAPGGGFEVDRLQRA